MRGAVLEQNILIGVTCHSIIYVLSALEDRLKIGGIEMSYNFCSCAGCNKCFKSPGIGGCSKFMPLAGVVHTDEGEQWFIRGMCSDCTEEFSAKKNKDEGVSDGI